MSRLPGDDEVLSAVLDIHNRDRWTGRTLLADGPLRRALIRRGLLVRRDVRNGTRPRGWKLTDAARQLLVNVPGSGVTRREAGPAA